MIWKSVVSDPPPLDVHVLLRYTKNKKVVFTEGYLQDRKAFLSEVYPDAAERGTWDNYGLIYYDYADRQIQDLTAKSKNKVTHWCELPSLT